MFLLFRQPWVNPQQDPLYSARVCRLVISVHLLWLRGPLRRIRGGNIQSKFDCLQKRMRRVFTQEPVRTLKEWEFTDREHLPTD